MSRKQYRKREQQVIIAVQLNLQSDGFKYHKWGSEQVCRSGDWLVDNNGDCYTINEKSFANTYREIAPGQYEKFAPVWASQVERDGKVRTNEGYTEYVVGDYLVSNNEDGSDSYAVSRDKFEQMYEAVPAN